jgi:Carboxypeptidase regulatory-like domain/TonB-dependent Receptor Plug Domain
MNIFLNHPKSKGTTTGWQVVSIALLLAVSQTVLAQGLTGSLGGTVKDASGGAIPNARVKISDAATGVVTFSGVTDAEGNYLAPALPNGSYNFEVEAVGFKRYERRGVVLELGQRGRVDVQMEPGAVTESVQVTDNGAVALETETSSFEYSIKPEDISNLPLPSRDVLGLLGIVSGVSTDGDPTNPNTESISINGSRTLQTEITVDGVSGLTGGTGRIMRSPSAETLQEVRVLTSAYSAEFGRTSGGFINGVFKSGGNQYHGAVYEYFRNDKLNANSFFRNLRGEERPAERYNQFGLSFGGPLWMPETVKDWRRSQSSFFFFNFEGVRRVSPGTAILNMPSAAFRSGDFSASPVLIKDPALRLPCTNADRRGCFPGNIIPEARLDPAARKIMSLLPLPNAAGVADPATGRATANFINPNSSRFENEDYNLRLDRTAFNGRTRLAARVTHFQNVLNGNRNLPGILVSSSYPTGTTEGRRGWQTSLSWTQQWSAKFLTESFFGFGRVRVNVTPPFYGEVDVARDLGIARSTLPVTPRLNITGWVSLGPGDNALRRQADNIFQPSIAATWVRPKGAIKFGAQFRRNHFNLLYSDGRAYGVYNFTGEITSTNSAGGNAVNALADFLLGQVKTAEYEISSPLVGRRNYNLGLFAQHDWKLRPRLTLNLGVRYEYESPMTEVNNNYSRIDTGAGKLLVAGRNASETLDLEAAKANFGPRVGFAWSLNPRTVVRSAFGVFYAQTFRLLDNTLQFPGFFSVATFAGRGVGLAQEFPLSQGMPLNIVRNLEDPFAVERAATTANPLSFNEQYSELTPLAKTLQWNFGIQRELPKKVFLDVSYVASRGIHLPLRLPFNDVPFERADELARINQGAATQAARPFPTVSRFLAVAFAGTSSYHSLQVRARRQVKDFSIFSAYTWSKAIDDGSGALDFGQPHGADRGQYLQLTRYLDRAVSNFDRRHTASMTWQYRPNFWKWTRGFLVTGIFVARTGLPDTITQNNFNPVVQQQRPDAIGPYNAIYATERTNVGNGIRYLAPANSANFPLAPTGPFYTGAGANRRRVLPVSIGTLGRNTVRTPGEWSQDISIIREFRLKEKPRFQLRGEAFNVFNHTNFNGPDVGLNVIATTVNGQDAAVFNSPNFGLITSAKAPRFLQLVARIEF